MEWSFLKNNIYYRDGSLRDLYILHTDRTDWRKWIAYVNEHYKLEWFNGEKGINENKIDFKVIEAYWNNEHDLCSIAKVYVDTIQVNAYFSEDAEIENDIDPKEFNSIEDHHKLVKLMSDLSKLINKMVILTPENEQATILIKVEQDTITCPQQQ